MKMKDFVVGKAVVPSLQATDRNGALRELVLSLVNAGAIADEDGETIVRAVLDRERKGTTGFGKGVAVPHAKHEKIPRLMAVIGRSAGGIDFSALDHAPVYSVVLLLSPPGKDDEHLQAMERIFRHLSKDNFRKFLRQAETQAAIMDLIEEADQEQVG